MQEAAEASAALVERRCVEQLQIRRRRLGCPELDRSKDLDAAAQVALLLSLAERAAQRAGLKVESRVAVSYVRTASAVAKAKLKLSRYFGLATVALPGQPAQSAIVVSDRAEAVSGASLRAEARPKQRQEGQHGGT